MLASIVRIIAFLLNKIMINVIIQDYISMIQCKMPNESPQSTALTHIQLIGVPQANWMEYPNQLVGPPVSWLGYSSQLVGPPASWLGYFSQLVGPPASWLDPPPAGWGTPASWLGSVDLTNCTIHHCISLRQRNNHDDWTHRSEHIQGNMYFGR